MAGKSTAGRMKVIYAFLLLFGPAIFLVLMATRGCRHNFEKLEDYGAGNQYSFVDYRGKEFTSSDFKDNIVIVANIQETCPDSCGISFWHFNEMIYQVVRKNQKHLSHVKIITFATDAEGNPIDSLNYFQELMNDQVMGYNPDIWLLAKGDSKIIFDISKGDKHLKDQRAQYFGGDASQEMMILLDKENHVRMILNGHTEGMVRRMKECIALLEKEYDQEAARSK